MNSLQDKYKFIFFFQFAIPGKCGGDWKYIGTSSQFFINSEIT